MEIVLSKKTKKIIEPHPIYDEPSISIENGMKYLHFGSRFIQGAMQLTHPNHLYFMYTRQMMAWLLFLETSQVKTVNILGLGAGSLLKSCYRYCTKNTSFNCIEWNPQVTQCAIAEFRLPDSDRITVIHADARKWIKHNLIACDLLLVDLYNYEAEGPVAGNKKFYKDCYNNLNDIGVMSVNLFGYHKSYKKNVKHIKDIFDFAVEFEETLDGNRVVLGFKGPKLNISYESLLKRAKVVQNHTELEAVEMSKEIGSYLKLFK
ncbi:spermidine synthase [Taylorella equigenitalis ATCC 35865]|nr:spermidine synthase [Taylorella equigenitalis ATCC 35865]